MKGPGAAPGPGAALVTGAGKRLGKAVALALAAEGRPVAVHYNTSREPAEAVVAEIEAAGGAAVALGQDLGDLEAAGGLIERAAAALGPVTLLVNSASAYGADSLAEMTPESWRRLTGVNGAAPIFLMQAFAAQSGPGAPATAGGAVVNMLDVQMAAPAPGFVSYFAGKAALEIATRMAALELAPKIRVNGVAPGLVLRSGDQDDATFERRQRMTPLAAGLGPDDIVEAVLYLANAAHVTGHVLPVDSGQNLLGFGNADMRTASE